MSLQVDMWLQCRQDHVRSDLGHHRHQWSGHEHKRWWKAGVDYGALIGGLMRFTHLSSTMKSKSRRRSVAAVALTALAVLGLVAASCSGGDDDDPAPRRTTTTDRPTTTQPEASGDGQAAAFTAVESVVLEATDLADTLFKDPSAIDFPNDPDLEQLREFYTPDSGVPAGVVDQLQGLAEAGHHLQPSSVSGIFREMRVFKLEAVDPNTVRFRFCANQDRETADQDGNVVSQRAEVTQGTSEARRIDGVWLIHQMDRDAATSLPVQPGEGVPGICDTLYPRGGET